MGEPRGAPPPLRLVGRMAPVTPVTPVERMRAPRGGVRGNARLCALTSPAELEKEAALQLACRAQHLEWAAGQAARVCVLRASSGERMRADWFRWPRLVERAMGLVTCPAPDAPSEAHARSMILGGRLLAVGWHDGQPDGIGAILTYDAEAVRQLVARPLLADRLATALTVMAARLRDCAPAPTCLAVSEARGQLRLVQRFGGRMEAARTLEGTREERGDGQHARDCATVVSVLRA